MIMKERKQKMKNNLKKLFALLLSLAMVLSLSAAFAEGTWTLTCPNGAPALSVAILAAEHPENFTFISADTIAAAFTTAEADFIIAPIIAQTSMDPQEMRAWIPNIRYGAHAFGYRNFEDWLAHREECLDVIERISPAALLRKIDPARAPHVVFQGGAMPKGGELAKDPTHSPVFMAKFKDIADARGVKCEIVSGPQPCFGAAFVRLAEILSK